MLINHTSHHHTSPHLTSHHQKKSTTAATQISKIVQTKNVAMPVRIVRQIARAQSAQTQSAPQKKSVDAPKGATPATAAAAAEVAEPLQLPAGYKNVVIRENQLWCSCCEALFGNGQCDDCFHIKDNPLPLPKRRRSTVVKAKEDQVMCDTAFMLLCVTLLQ